MAELPVHQQGCIVAIVLAASKAAQTQAHASQAELIVAGADNLGVAE